MVPHWVWGCLGAAVAVGSGLASVSRRVRRLGSHAPRLAAGAELKLGIARDGFHKASRGSLFVFVLGRPVTSSSMRLRATKPRSELQQKGAGRGLQVASCGLREMVRLQVAGRLGRVLQVVGFTVARARRGFREELLDAPCSRLSIVRFDTGPKRSMGHLLGGEKNNFFNSRY